MSERIYHRRFASMRGVELLTGGDGASTSHFAELGNMWCSPTPSEAVVETVPGVRACHRFAGAIYGLWAHQTASGAHLVVHAGEALYRFPLSLRDQPQALSALSPIHTGLAKERGCAFAVGERLCLLIGGAYLVISGGGEVSILGEDEGYVPLLYLNGEPHEQRNLLTDRVRMAYTAEVGLYGSAVGEEGLLFAVLDRTAKTCSVRIAPAARAAGAVEVPSYATIGGEAYSVVAVADDGFAEMPSLCRIALPETLEYIGARAFSGCSALRTLSLPSGVKRIGKAAFENCFTLQSLHLGSSLTEVTAPVFSNCLLLSEVAFGGTEEQFKAIRNTGEAGTALLPDGILITLCTYIAPDTAELLRLPTAEPLATLEEVLLGVEPIGTDFTPLHGSFARYQPILEEGRITAVEVSVLDRAVLEGRQIILRGKLSPISLSEEQPLDGRQAILGCRICALYDGRIFLSGNKRLPNTLFYSSFGESGQCDPFYFGLLDRLNDGEGYTENAALLPVGTALAVIKRDEGGGGMYFHTPADTGEAFLPRVYPATEGAAGMGTVGCAVSFRDDPVFLTTGGLYAITKQGSNLERSLLCRSSRIAPALSSEHLARARCAVARGYLWILTEGRLYLADSRRLTAGPLGHYEYEWYPLFGIGGYTDDHLLYRYMTPTAEMRAAGFEDAAREGEAVTGEVYSRATEQGMVYYTVEDGHRYAVDSRGERTGGLFSPATELCAVDDIVFFGTSDGILLCFNEDRRGLSLYRTEAAEGYVLLDGEYLPLSETGGTLVGEDTVRALPLYRREGDAFAAVGEEITVYVDGKSAARASLLRSPETEYDIDTHWYSFAGHAYPSYCSFAMEDGGLPQYAKNTEPRSVTAKVKTFSGGGFTLLYRTDRHPWRIADTRALGRGEFGTMDFSAFDFHSDRTAILSLREKARGWCEKQYRFVSAEYGRPFGICHLAYSYRIAGRIKE